MKKIILSLILCSIPTVSYAQTQTAYNPGKDPKYTLGQGSNVDFDLNFRMGTGGVHIYIGTETCNGVGTNGVVVGSSSAAPQIAVNYAAGSTTFNMKNMHVKVDGSELMTTGSGIASVSGSGSDTTLINPTFEGTGSVGANFSLTANGENISDNEIAFLNGLYGGIQSQLDGKVGSSTPRIGAVECGGTSTAGTAGSTTVKFLGGGDLTTSMTDDGGGHFTITTALSGTASAKADIKEGGTTKVTGATDIDFDESDFDVAADGAGANIALSDNLNMTNLNVTNLKLPGTLTPFIGTDTDTMGVIQQVVENVYSPYPHDPDTELLLHWDGTSGDDYTTFKDHSENARNSFTVNGTPMLSSAQVKFGSTSVRINVGSLSYPGGSYLNFTGNFTIETWIRWVSIGQDHDACKETFIWQDSGHRFYLAGKSMGLWYVNEPNGISHAAGSWTPSVDTWYHVAVVNNEGNLRTFVDGVQVGGTTTISLPLTGCGTSTPWISRSPDTGHVGNIDQMNGYLDEYRISKSARYTGNFTPPTSDFHSNYNKYSLRYVAPTNDALITAITHGTETHYNTTVLIGTTTQANSGSSPAYALETLNILGSSYVVRACNSRMKTPTEVDPVKIENNVISSLDNSKIFQYQWDNPNDIRNNTDNYGIMLDDGCPPEILAMDGLPEITKWCGYLQVVNKALLRRIKKQRQEIDTIQEILNRNNIR